MSGLRNPFAVRNGQTILIEDLAANERGLNCKCNCPACNGDFVARMGKVKIHHFAHTKDACDEVLAYTSGLYRMIHQVLGGGNPFYIPALAVTYTLPDIYVLNENNMDSHVRIVDEHYYATNKIVISPGRRIKFEDAELIYDSKNHIQAIVLTYRNSTMAIKVMPPDTVCKTGSVSAHKNMSTLVLDFTDDIDVIQTSNSESFQNYLLSEKLNKRWIHNSKIENAYPEIIEKSEKAFQVHQEREKRLEEERKRIAQWQAAQREEYEKRINEEKAAEQKAAIARLSQQEGDAVKFDYSGYMEEFNQNKGPVFDLAHCRLMKCEICGEIKRATAFSNLPVGNRINFGRCRECSRSGIRTEHERTKAKHLTR